MGVFQIIAVVFFFALTHLDSSIPYNLYIPLPGGEGIMNCMDVGPRWGEGRKGALI
jgi:hypothetical protein